MFQEELYQRIQFYAKGVTNPQAYYTEALKLVIDAICFVELNHKHTAENLYQIISCLHGDDDKQKTAALVALILIFDKISIDRHRALQILFYLTYCLEDSSTQENLRNTVTQLIQQAETEDDADTFHDLLVVRTNSLFDVLPWLHEPVNRSEKLELPEVTTKPLFALAISQADIYNHQQAIEILLTVLKDHGVAKEYAMQIYVAFKEGSYDAAMMKQVRSCLENSAYADKKEEIIKQCRNSGVMNNPVKLLNALYQGGDAAYLQASMIDYGARMGGDTGVLTHSLGGHCFEIFSLLGMVLSSVALHSGVYESLEGKMDEGGCLAIFRDLYYTLKLHRDDMRDMLSGVKNTAKVEETCGAMALGFHHHAWSTQPSLHHPASNPFHLAQFFQTPHGAVFLGLTIALGLLYSQRLIALRVFERERVTCRRQMQEILNLEDMEIQPVKKSKELLKEMIKFREKRLSSEKGIMISVAFDALMDSIYMANCIHNVFFVSLAVGGLCFGLTAATGGWFLIAAAVVTALLLTTALIAKLSHEHQEKKRYKETCFKYDIELKRKILAHNDACKYSENQISMPVDLEAIDKKTTWLDNITLFFEDKLYKRFFFFRRNVNNVKNNDSAARAGEQSFAGRSSEHIERSRSLSGVNLGAAGFGLFADHARDKFRKEHADKASKVWDRNIELTKRQDSALASSVHRLAL